MPEVGQWGPEPFLDRRGRGLTNLTVTVYETDGTTLAVLYTDQTGTTVLANPLPIGVATTAAGLDVRGNVSFYAEPGAYELAADSDGSEVYRSPITVSVDTDTGGGGAVDSVNGLIGAVVLDAVDIPFTPGGTVAATNVQAAIDEAALEAGAGGAPTTADYLTGTTQAGLSAEIVVGPTPGGELGGTWGVPTVDAVHSGSSHAAVQAAAEATAATYADTKVSLTGAEVVAGVKTFTSDPIIPDEVYGAGWNGSLEPPTKNAVYDQIESVVAGAPALHAATHADGGTDEVALDASQIVSGILANARLDPDLAAIAVLSTTAYGRSVLETANAAALRTLAGLVIGTDVQAQDPELQALSGLVSAANTIPRFTGSGTAVLSDFINDNTFATATTTNLASALSIKTYVDDSITGLDELAGGVGTTVNTTVPGFASIDITDAELAAILGLISAADRLPYFTGPGTAALATFTGFARTLVDDPDAPTARATLGLVIGTDVQAFSADTAYRTDKLSVFAATTSAELAGVITDESGTGALVFGTSPTIVTPTIASFTNATHSHQNAAGGGTLDHGLALTGLGDDDHTQYFLSAGRAGGQSAIGGTAASEGLTLGSTANPTRGFISIRDKVLLISEDKAFSETDVPQNLIDVPPARTITFSAGAGSGFFLGNLFLAFNLAPTIVFAATGSTFGSGAVFRNAAVIKNNASATRTITGFSTFISGMTYQADGATVTYTQDHTALLDGPVLQIINAGVLSFTGTLNTVYSSLTIGAGCTLSARNGFVFLDATGAGTLTAQTAIDIAALTKGGTNIGIKNASSLVQSGASTFTGTVTVTDVNVVLSATTGTKFGTATTQKLSFYGATPIVRPSAYTQTFATADKTHAARTSSAVATTGSTSTVPFGYTTAAQADAIVTAINAVRADLDDTAQVVNALLDDLQALGLVG